VRRRRETERHIRLVFRRAQEKADKKVYPVDIYRFIGIASAAAGSPANPDEPSGRVYRFAPLALPSVGTAR
jgi:hypothetical protein